MKFELPKIKIGLRLKISLIVTIVVLIAIGVSTLTSSILFLSEYAAMTEKCAMLIGQNLTSRLESALNKDLGLASYKELDDLCREAVKRNPELSYVYVLGTDGKMIFHSDALGSASWAELPSFLQSVAVSGAIVRRTHIREAKPFTEIILPVRSERPGSTTVLVEMGFTPDFAMNRVTRLISLSVVIALATFILEILLLIIFLNNWVTMPLHELSLVIHSVTEKKMLLKNVEIESNDEIGRLAESFSAMMEELHRTMVSREYLDKIIKNIADMLIIIDTEMQIVRVNNAACELLGYEDHELKGKPFSLVLSETGSPLSFENLERLVYEGKITELETYYKAKDGRNIPVLMNSSVLTDDSENITHIVCVASDMTERTQSEAKIDSLNKLVYQISHQAGMAEIATGILHNIGNILTSINISSEEIGQVIQKSKLAGFLRANELLEENAGNLFQFLSEDPRGKVLPEYYAMLGKELSEEHLRIANEIKLLSENVSLVRDVIDAQQRYAWGSSGTDDVGLIAAIEDALKIQGRNFFRNEVKVEKSYDGNGDAGELGFYSIKVAKSKLIYILVNVLKNAVEAMKETEPDRKVINIDIENGADGSLDLLVSDQGEGIREEHMGVIFNYSFTTKKDGHGFGLHTCAQIMKELGGSIRAESDGRGKGSCFIITFPERAINKNS